MSDPTLKERLAGEMKDATRPVVAYRPKISPCSPTGVTRARSERLAACAGPTNADSSSPPTQNTIEPRPLNAKMTIAISTSPESANTMTALGPNLSSARPAKIVETPATTFAAIAKMMTSVSPKPKATAASTPPNAKTPASPSR